MADLEVFYREQLSREFLERKRKNSRYSLRGYAKSLGVDNGYLSKLLKGKSLISLDLADAITKKLKLSTEVRNRFLKSAAEEQMCHALYLIDPNLTECDPSQDDQNKLPIKKKTC